MKCRFLLVVFLFIILSLPVLSQQDSLVDVFPLSVGNQWTYHYNSYQWVFGDYTVRDTGTSRYKIIAKVETLDSTRWLVSEHRYLVHCINVIFPPLFDTCYVLTDSSTLEIIERHEGNHRLYVNIYNPLSVFPFSFNIIAPTPVYRFMRVNPAGDAYFISHDSSSFYCEKFTFNFRKNVGEMSVLGQDTNCVGYQFTTLHTLLNYILVSVHDIQKETVPTMFSLHQNYPNPFNPSTTIEYALPHESRISLKLYDVLGREVMTLADGVQQAGLHRAVLNANGLSSGMYFYKLVADGFVDMKKLILLR